MAGSERGEMGLLLFALAALLHRLHQQQRRQCPLKTITPVSTSSDARSDATQQPVRKNLVVDIHRPALPILQMDSSLTSQTPSNYPAGSDLDPDMGAVEQREILLHNISHADMILSLSEDDSVMARPKFSHFRKLSEMMYAATKLTSKLELVNYPVYTRDNQKAKRPINSESEVGDDVPVGIDFKELMESEILEVDNLDQLRFRQKDREKLLPGQKHKIFSVYFPLLAALIPKWENYILERRRGMHNQCTKLMIFLISGQGTPRDESANVVDNSTDTCAYLMKAFLEKASPYIEVKLIPSPNLNLFRYDENIQFVKRYLLPEVESIRSSVVQQVRDKWKEYMHIYLSYASGSSARVSAIGASLRPYRPSYMHFWQLKTFWNDSKICKDDIECHSYTEISTTPAVPLDSTDAQVQLVVNHMKDFKRMFEQMKCGDHDMKDFWLRKSKKPVLSVLLVQKEGDPKPKLYRGTNMEVSMPTGSLCAERNVIGTALADDLTLKRHHLKYIAVLSLSLKNSPSLDLQNIDSCDCDGDDGNFDIGYSCMDEPVKNENPHGSNAITEASREVYSFDSCSPPSSRLTKSISEPLSVPKRNPPIPQSPQRVVKITTLKGSDSPKITQRNSGRKQLASECKEKSTPLRSLVSFSALHEPPTQHAVMIDESDMNPLKPCGACHEWLKKFAEVNPSFSVITFTDSDFNGIYVEQIES